MIAVRPGSQGQPHEALGGEHTAQRPHEMLARLTHDHYIVLNDDDKYRFCYSVVQRWWCHQRVAAVSGDHDEQQAGLDQ